MPDVRDNIIRITKDRAHNQSVIARRAGMTPESCAPL